MKPNRHTNICKVNIYNMVSLSRIVERLAFLLMVVIDVFKCGTKLDLPVLHRRLAAVLARVNRFAVLLMVVIDVFKRVTELDLSVIHRRLAAVIACAGIKLSYLALYIYHEYF